MTEFQNSSTLHICIYRTSSIGDVVLASVCLDLLEKMAIPMRVTWFGRPPSLDLIKGAYPHVRCITVPRRLQRREWQQLFGKVERADLIINLQTNLRAYFFCRGLQRRTKAPIFRAKKRSFARSFMVFMARLRGRIFQLPEHMKQPKTFQYDMMLTPLALGVKRIVSAKTHGGCKDPASFKPEPRLPIPQVTRDAVFEELCGRFHELGSHPKRLALAVGASHETKRAPEDVFVAILERLKQKKLDLPALLFLGDYADASISTEILKRVAWPAPIVNFSGEGSLLETAVVLTKCSGLLTNDSALGHIAEAVGIPVSTLFGPTVEAFGFPPRLPSSRAFSSRLGCRPCSRHGKKPCRYGDQKCFKTLDIELVVNHLVSLVTDRPSCELE